MATQPAPDSGASDTAAPMATPVDSLPDKLLPGEKAPWVARNHPPIQKEPPFLLGCATIALTLAGAMIIVAVGPVHREIEYLGVVVMLIGAASMKAVGVV